jgi:hypothetical protein
MTEGGKVVAVCEHRPVDAESDVVCVRCGEVLGLTITMSHTDHSGDSVAEIVDEELIEYEEHEVVSRRRVIAKSFVPAVERARRNARRRLTRDYKKESDRYGNAWAKAHRDRCTAATRRWRARKKAERDQRQARIDVTRRQDETSEMRPRLGCESSCGQVSKPKTHWLKS